MLCWRCDKEAVPDAPLCACCVSWPAPRTTQPKQPTVCPEGQLVQVGRKLGGATVVEFAPLDLAHQRVYLTERELVARFNACEDDVVSAVYRCALAALDRYERLEAKKR